ncbi:universal stress protein [Streptomyces sp. PTD5-9]|uniref:universal stress protein n=1 Tax=Streptomyces sp. PTD5-9 TaxID=3120150 RepID=UPI00300BACDB
MRQPVVLVRAPEDVPPGAGSGDAGRGVVVGVDLGRPCDALLAFAFEEASRRHRTLTALHSWMLPPLAGTGAAYSAEANALIARSTETDLEHLLSPWRDRYPSVVLDARAAVGHPSRQLLEACAGAELVVVGRRIRRARIGGHVGPVTHAVLHHSTAPVAVVAHS